MIVEKEGSALDAPRGIIVHGCNAHGVMGGGFAYAVKNKYPGAYQAYREVYESKGLKLGNVIYHVETSDIIIANAVTQYDMGSDKRYVDYEAVAVAFEDINKTTLHLSELGAKYGGKPFPIVFPAIGAGLAGGNWNIISTIIDETLDSSLENHYYPWKK
jgi:O-acetyl-ADP-ribose deacetylase (regulator of RNase III)